MRKESAAGAELFLADCLVALKAMPDNSVDSIVTDPPYGLTSARPGGRSPATKGGVMRGFMGLQWDGSVPSVEVWAECLRVLKPGGYLLAFAGTRTQHRMAVRIEDAGFEIRDMIAWVYGSGFPKSLDVSKAIDKAGGASPREQSEMLRAKRQVQGIGHSGALRSGGHTEAARQWQGWGTALKPALEPITVARKPLIGTVAANVLQHGTGAINVDGCRVDATGDAQLAEKFASVQNAGRRENSVYGSDSRDRAGAAPHPAGRFPANLIHDGSDEVVALFPDSGGSGGSVPNVKITGYGNGIGTGKSEYSGGERTKHNAGSGSAARFFYCAKASKKDRGEGNAHPTVKPTELMRYLCRLVTPPGGTVLDPFMGSGSTGKAALLEGFVFIGIEREQESFDTAAARIGFAGSARAVAAAEAAQMELL
ncbi:MAG: DNA-methyltransferase [Afipia sp.]